MTDRLQAIRAGRTIVVAHSDSEHLWRHADQLRSSDHTLRETPHFLVLLPPNQQHRRAVLMHTFSTTTIDEDLPAMIADELGPIGVVSTPREYDATFRAIVASTSAASLHCPDCGQPHLDLSAGWRHYGLNTLRRLRSLLSDHVAPSTVQVYSHIAQFAAVYRRILQCCTGASLLDVGTSLGLLPILVAERYASMNVVGADYRQDAISCATDLAAAAGAHRVKFIVKDVLTQEFPAVGSFDTVTAVHLLEHLREDALPLALTNMLSVTAERLIVSVPYEENVQDLYGHKQLFTPEKLQFWGNWCVETLGGGQFQCHDVSGGLLIVDRSTNEIA